jgi:hypothetical protein
MRIMEDACQIKHIVMNTWNSNNFNNLIHLATIGNQYNWANDIRGYDYAANRVVCNL